MLRQHDRSQLRRSSMDRCLQYSTILDCMSRLETELKALSISKIVIETYKGRNIPRESFICCIKVVIRDTVLALGHNCPVASVPAINTAM